MTKLEREVRWLRLSNLAAWVALGLVALGGRVRAEPDRARFDVLDVERLNVVAPGGKPVLVLAHRQRMPGPSMNGRDYPPALADGRELLSGMLFFNDAGDEVGGLLFNGIEKPGGHSAVGHLSFDQWKQNQVVALQYVDSGKSRRAGLAVWDRPTDQTLATQLERGERMLDASGPALEALKREAAAARAAGADGVQRLFFGSRDRSAQVELRDTKGRVRARLVVDEHDEARLEFLDADGRPVARFPHAASEQAPKAR